MAVVNPLAREVVFKIVYYGPGLGGKTSSLQHVHAATSPEHRGKMVSLATPVDRTLYFDYLPLRIPDVRGLGVRLQLFTVPGQVYYNATRKLVLTGADAVVFVADSQRVRLEANLESFENLVENLREHGRELGEMPHVLQYNKRDLAELVPLEELDLALNRHRVPALATVATQGEGIFEALEAVTLALLRDFERRAPAETPVEQRELALPEGGLAEALRRAEGESSPRSPTPLPPRVRAGSGPHALGLPPRAPGELAARALADRSSAGPSAPGAPSAPAAGSAAAPPTDPGTLPGLPGPSPLPAGPFAPSPSVTPAEPRELSLSPPSPREPSLAAPAEPRELSLSPPELSGLGGGPPAGGGLPTSEGGFGFGPLWPPSERVIADEVEAAIARGDRAGAVLAADHLVARSLAAVAAQLGAGGDAPRDPAVVALLLGLDGRRYVEFRSLVREARAGRALEEREALLAYAFAVEVRLARW